MNFSIPEGARAAARVLLLDEQNRLLLLETQDFPGGHRCIVCGDALERVRLRSDYPDTGYTCDNYSSFVEAGPGNPSVEAPAPGNQSQAGDMKLTTAESKVAP